MMIVLFYSGFRPRGFTCLNYLSVSQVFASGVSQLMTVRVNLYEISKGVFTINHPVWFITWVVFLEGACYEIETISPESF
jgi:hypothetical protein